MKEEMKVYIKGVPGRGDEVRQALIDLGGKAYHYINYNLPGYLYFMNHHGEIKYTKVSCDIGKIIMDNYREIKLPEQWKDGDVLVNVEFGDCFAVCKSVCNARDDAYHCYMYADFGCDEIDAEGVDILRSTYRLATPSEVERFHELLHRHGKEWDAEKKQLVNWRWKPKNEEAYYFVDTNTSVYEIAYDENNINDSINFEVGNCFRTREEAEAMAEKIKKLLKDEKTMTKYYVTFFTDEGYISNTFDIKKLDITAIDRLYDWCEKKTGVKGNIINITKLEI